MTRGWCARHQAPALWWLASRSPLFLLRCCVRICGRRSRGSRSPSRCSSGRRTSHVLRAPNSDLAGLDSAPQLLLKSRAQPKPDRWGNVPLSSLSTASGTNRASHLPGDHDLIAMIITLSLAGSVSSSSPSHTKERRSGRPWSRFRRRNARLHSRNRSPASADWRSRPTRSPLINTTPASSSCWPVRSNRS